MQELIVSPLPNPFSALALIAMLFGLGFTVRTIFKERDDLEGSWYRRNRSMIFAYLAVFFAWSIDYVSATRYSANATARQTLDNIIGAWQTGERAKVLKALDELSNSVTPWESNYWE